MKKDDKMANRGSNSSQENHGFHPLRCKQLTVLRVRDARLSLLSSLSWIGKAFPKYTKSPCKQKPLSSNMPHFKLLTIILPSISRFCSFSTCYVFENTSKKYTVNITSIKIQICKIHYGLCTEWPYWHEKTVIPAFFPDLT